MNEGTTDNDKFLNSIWAFFILVLIISFTFGLPVVFSSSPPYEFPNMFFLILAAGGPGIAAIILISYNKGKVGLKELGKKIIEIKRIGGRWYLFIFLYFPITVGFAVLLNYLISGVMPEFGTLNGLLAVPVLIIFFVVLNIVFGPFPEEIGWRGYGIDKCQEKWNALYAGLILGSFWAFWHVPLFFIEGTYHYELGAFSLYFWLFCIDAICFSILLAWVYNNNENSTLSAIILHFMANTTGQLLEPTGFALICRTVINLAFTILVVYIWGPQTLTKESNN